MSYKVRIPRHLITEKITSSPEVFYTSGFHLNMKFEFAPDVAKWLTEHVGDLPKIMVSRYDFEENEFWVEMPDPSIASAFRLTWS